MGRTSKLFKAENFTNVGRYKPKTYKRRTGETSDQDKRRTSTNVRLVQTSDSTNVEPVQTSDYKEKKYLNFKTGLIKI